MTIRDCTLVEHLLDVNYFMVVRLFQAYDLQTDKSLISKQRTDISMNTNSGKPRFLKNKMHFKGIRGTNVSGKTQIEFLLYMAP